MMSLSQTNLLMVQVSLRQSMLLTQELAENSESAIAELDEETSDLDDV